MGSINVLLTTFSGLDLPPTVCLPVPADLSTQHLSTLVASLLPSNAATSVYLTTTDNRIVKPSNSSTVASLFSSPWRGSHDVLPLRLSVPLVGGKGGFGSQLRAAGGRMSSRKKKQNAELASGSARNLDGRRLRTITEAKNLATYLATKPDMDRKEKEERRKRWQAVVDLAEQREADMRAGKTVDGRRKGLSSEWMEEKEEVGENVKNAVKLAMAATEVEEEPAKKSGSSGSGASNSESADEDSDDEDPMELDEEDMIRLRKEAEMGDADAIWVLQHKLKIPQDLLPKQRKSERRFAGFDDDVSDDSDEEDEPAKLTATIATSTSTNTVESTVK